MGEECQGCIDLQAEVKVLNEKYDEKCDEIAASEDELAKLKEEDEELRKDVRSDIEDAQGHIEEALSRF